MISVKIDHFISVLGNKHFDIEQQETLIILLAQLRNPNPQNDCSIFRFLVKHADLSVISKLLDEQVMKGKVFSARAYHICDPLFEAIVNGRNDVELFRLLVDVKLGNRAALVEQYHLNMKSLRSPEIRLILEDAFHKQQQDEELK